MQISRAFIEDYDKIDCFIVGLDVHSQYSFSVYSDGVNIPILSMFKCPFDNQEYKLALKERLNPEAPCYLVCNNNLVLPLEPLGIYNKPEFNEKYYYEGRLGSFVSEGKTTFRLWSPFAQAVSLNVFVSGDGDGDNILGKRMKRGVKGIWEITINSNLAGKYYTYTIVHNGKEAIETADPYAFSGGFNGKRSMVVDFADEAIIPFGWANEHEEYKEKHSLKQYTDAVIWEVHVRDFSGKTNAKNKFKFLAFTESGLKNAAGESIGLDYLEDLGITHVHLLPIAEYATVDQKRLNEPCYNAFNWGYDSLNFNSPMGAYSNEPNNGKSRVYELRQLVAALHKRGIGVIMDVVYNHTYNFDAPLAKAVPNYYYRFDNRGNPTNGSGCGNETASEKPMCRKFIIDSLMNWVKIYHIDGFRFDLMGLHDLDTMREVERTIHANNPGAILYGEGWVGGPTALWGDRQCSKWNINCVPQSEGASGSIAVFSDVMRDSVKGAVFRGEEGGYVNGRANDCVNNVKFSTMGATSPNFNTGWVLNSANKAINYVSAHDNNTLWDKLSLTCACASIDERLRMNRMAAAIVMTSRGVPFFQAGEELMRSKPYEGGGYEENSYNSPDEMNNIDWDKLIPNSDCEELRNYYRGLIAFRKKYSVLRLTDPVEIEDATDFCYCPRYDMIAYTLKNKDRSEELFVIYNPYDEALVTLPEGKWELYVSDKKAGTEKLGLFEKTVFVPYKCVYVLVKAKFTPSPLTSAKPL